ncbi:MAG: endonuclease domain-containing protein [Bacteroidales bacterium]|nr:endonuclease domain-containing protein [Bacteroidales bacterium]MCF8344652.1 endonuclease domain-containing protein [Bacteroidales bacterium]MCF8376220.1 endonuclease domain-containing protein [Bacteroidales bacterium]MCF8402241.1 endonuclease domain-containing protein [Bacteroidales bacterium]
MAYKRKTIIPEFYFGAKPKLIKRAAELREKMTSAERLLWSVLRKRQVKGFYFRRQHPLHIFIADFYCHEARLVIEVDGEIHQLPAQKEYDIGRTDSLDHFGIKVLRIKNEDVLYDMGSVIQRISEALPDYPP